MPDDKTKVGEPDRNRVAVDQDYELRNIAERHRLTLQQVRELMDRVGNDREKLDQAASKLSTSKST
jgi:uncharacterized protein DUF3606